MKSSAVDDERATNKSRVSYVYPIQLEQHTFYCFNCHFNYFVFFRCVVSFIHYTKFSCKDYIKLYLCVKMNYSYKCCSLVYNYRSEPYINVVDRKLLVSYICDQYFQ